MSSCIFCKIVKREIPAEILYEDEEILAFKDISPQAPLHLLWISKRHIEGLDQIEPSDSRLLGEMLQKISEYASKHPQFANGYRVCTNIGAHGGQTVRHLHFHLLGGKELSQTMV